MGPKLKIHFLGGKPKGEKKKNYGFVWFNFFFLKKRGGPLPFLFDFGAFERGKVF